MPGKKVSVSGNFPAKTHRQTTAADVPPAVEADFERIPHPASDDFAYLVAYLAWHEGLAANAIVSRIGWDSSSAHLMQVKRALKRAHGKFFQLILPDVTKLTTELDACVNSDPDEKKITFHIADDEYLPRGGGVFLKAAEVATEVIEGLLSSPSAVSRAVICNAGGRTVYGMVKELLSRPPLLPEDLDEAPRVGLEFVAGNSAYQRESFHHSASYLSVTIANCFKATSWAMPAVLSDDDRREHKQLVKQSKLFICGAGSCSPEISSVMSKLMTREKIPIPPRAVGDLCFNLLDADGEEVAIPEAAREFMSRVNPSINLEMMRTIASKNRILLLLQEQDHDSKLPIGLAALRGRYCTDVVLGSRLARQILQAWKS